MSGRLQGKIAIVTGAGCIGPGWGNGRATTCRFFEEGAKVFAVDISESALEETLQRVEAVRTDNNNVAAKYGELETHICNATDNDSVAAMIDAAVQRFGGLDILVNNVGAPARGGPVDLTEEAWDAQIDINLKSVFLTCKHAIPCIEETLQENNTTDNTRRNSSNNNSSSNNSSSNSGTTGAIVNIASTSGIRWTGNAQVGYAASKAGVIQFSRVAAVEYAARGIRVNSIVPGQLHTPMVEARLAGMRTSGDVDALLADRLARIPLGYMGDGRDTANAAVYLASDEASFVTGTEIVVDGGMSARCD